MNRDILFEDVGCRFNFDPSMPLLYAGYYCQREEFLDGCLSRGSNPVNRHLCCTCITPASTYVRHDNDVRL